MNYEDYLRTLRAMSQTPLRQQMAQMMQLPSWGQQGIATAQAGWFADDLVQKRRTAAPSRKAEPVPLGELIDGIGMEPVTRALEFV